MITWAGGTGVGGGGVEGVGGVGVGCGIGSSKRWLSVCTSMVTVATGLGTGATTRGFVCDPRLLVDSGIRFF